MSSFLPGRRRAEDADSRVHERALALAAESLIERLPPEEEAWLGGHLDRCDSCAAIADEYEAESRLLRSMPWPEPPRDLWARTAAAIEAHGGDRRRASSGMSPGSLVPLGALSGALVVGVVVVAAFLATPAVPPVTPSTQPLPSTAVGSPSLPTATPIVVAAGQVGWVTQRADGGYTVAYAPVKKVCGTDIKPDCAPLAAASPIALTLQATPGAIVGAPDAKQLVVVDSKTKSTGGSLYVVDLAASGTPRGDTTPGGSPSTSPASSSSVSPSPSPSASPSPTLPSIAIARDVVVVGETGAYSADGRSFAFSARPADGSHGPDIFVWSPGDASAHPVTDDHRSVFAGWSGDLIIGSRAVVEDASAVGSASPEPSTGASTASATAPAPSSTGSGASTEPSAGASSAEPAASVTPSDGASLGPIGTIASPVSFVLDPATRASAVIPGTAMWRPVVDATGTYAAFWQGTLRLADNGVDWLPDAGALVVDRWSGAGIEPEPSSSASPSPSTDPAASSPASPSPSATPSPSPSPSPSPTPSSSASPSATTAPSESPRTLPVALSGGPVRDWDIRWDETGTRLAVWLADPVDATVGSLALHTLDRASDTLDAEGVMLDQQPALAGFSIGSGRLAWATPPGQGGEGSRVEVLAWSGASAGRIESQPGPGPGPVVVIR